MVHKVISTEAAIKIIDDVLHQEETHAIIISKINRIIKKDSHITHLK